MVRHFPSFCFALARRVGKVRLENGNTPARPSLSEAAQANMVLPALRIDCFLAQTRPQLKPTTASPANGDDAPLLFELHTPRHGIHATARLEGGEFVVQAGSQSRGTWAGKGTVAPQRSRRRSQRPPSQRHHRMETPNHRPNLQGMGSRKAEPGNHRMNTKQLPINQHDLLRWRTAEEEKFTKRMWKQEG